MRLAALLIRQDKVADITEGRKGCTFGQAPRQLVRFQVDVEEVTHASEAQTAQRRVCKRELKKTHIGSKSPTSRQE